jgi:hypothetical protein
MNTKTACRFVWVWTWSLILREGYKLEVSENRIMRWIFGPNRYEITEGWRKMHNKELRNMYEYSSSNIIRMMKSRRMRWVGHVACRTGMHIMRNSEVKRPLRIPRRRWDDNIKMDIKEIWWVVWTGFIWLRIRTSGGFLWTWYWTFGFHKVLGNSWVDERLATSQKGLSSVSKYYYYDASTALCWALAVFSVSLSYTQSAGLLGQGINPSQGLYLHGINAHTQTSMPGVGFEHTNPGFERAKTVHALDCAATGIGRFKPMPPLNLDHFRTDTPNQHSVVSWIVCGVLLWCTAIVYVVSGFLFNGHLRMSKG